ncbi:MAG: hypothetical protein GXY50_08700, partial [Syntrophomonadaceae bacterium]|nr:hypothetical protein [Syntrophomonadaceae bacterium]
RQWLEQKYRELNEREKKIKQLAEECSMIRLEMEPLEKWLVQMEGQGIVDELKAFLGRPVPEPVNESEALDEETDNSEELIELKGNPLRDEVVNLLGQVYPGMMYYRELLQCLEGMGYQVGGKDPGLNLIAHISTDKRIVRGDKRGMYGLSDDFAQELDSVKVNISVKSDHVIGQNRPAYR